MIYATDLDGMLFAYPEQLPSLLCSLQIAGNKVGVVSARPQSEAQEMMSMIQMLGFNPDFFIAKSEAHASLSDGCWKAMACNEASVDILFDDFEYSDPQMVADFFSINCKTLPLTSWAYQP